MEVDKAPVPGTVLSISTAICNGAETPSERATSWSAGKYLATSAGVCLDCDSACSACNGPSHFDCKGACKYGHRDKRGACATGDGLKRLALNSRRWH